MDSAPTNDVRVRQPVDGDEPAVRRMLSAYHLVTEREKGCRVDHPDELPASYRSEMANAGGADRRSRYR
jgi:hypothetical protein